jgi:MoaA/NifB/PqqE/SkfB family radical SAM enzyme
LQQRVAERKLRIDLGSQHDLAVDAIGRAPRGLNDGKGFVFISHKGEVFPSGFLPLSAGNIREQELATTYPHAEEPCCSYVPKNYLQSAPQLKSATTLHVLQGA